MDRGEIRRGVERRHFRGLLRAGSEDCDRRAAELCRWDVVPGLSCTAPSSGDDGVMARARALKIMGLVSLISSNSRRQRHRVFDALTTETMEYFSLKRSTVADRGQANLSSKVYVRSTKSGKVQKIVRELYLRQDIPCSSNLCRECLEIAPTDYSKKGEFLCF